MEKVRTRKLDVFVYETEREEKEERGKREREERERRVMFGKSRLGLQRNSSFYFFAQANFLFTTFLLLGLFVPFMIRG